MVDKIVPSNNILQLIPNGTDKPDCKKCARALQELENIDDEADQLGIGFVKIADEELAEEYNLGPLPVLVYYRHQIPIIYERERSIFINIFHTIFSQNTFYFDFLLNFFTHVTLHFLL